MSARYTSPEGLVFEYSYNGFPNAVYFSHGKVSIVVSLPYAEWRTMSEEERSAWRKEKYAEALRRFNLHQGAHHGV